MLLILQLACESSSSESGSTDTGGTDTGDADTDSDSDTDSDADSDTDTDTDTAHTGDTSTGNPEYVFVEGTTGVQLDFTYSGTPGASDLIMYGLWGNADMDGAPGATGSTAATFPSSVTVEVAAGMWYCGAFLDVGGDSTGGPGDGDISARWASEGDIAYGIEVRDGYTTTGVTMAFTAP